MVDSRGDGASSPPAHAREPIRVLRVFSRLNVGGPSVHVILLSAGLTGRGYETRLVIGQEGPSEGNLLDLAAQKGVTCLSLPGLGREIRPLADLRALLDMYRILRGFRPAILHSHTAKAGVVGRVAALLAGVPIVVHTYHGHYLHGYFNRFVTLVFGALEALLGRASDALIAVSPAVKKDLVDFGVASEQKITVIPLGLELEHLAEALPRGALREEAGFARTAPLVGIVGRLVPIKDIGTFLAAAALLVQSHPEVRFAVVGDGEERAALEAESGRLGLGSLVRFFGWRRDLAAVYGDLDVVVNSSLNEGTPVSLIEALAAARPVVATQVGGTPDLLGAGERGVLVPPADAAALAGALRNVLDRPAEAIERAGRGQSYVLAHHSVSRLLRDVDDLYRSLLVRRARA